MRSACANGVLVAGTVLWSMACHSGEPFEIAVDFEASRQSTSHPTQLALQNRFACGLFNPGRIKCWGYSEYGALGVPGVIAISDPSAGAWLDFGTTRRVIQVAVGWHHACALFDDARVRCWGRNQRGQLGRGDDEDYGDDPSETLGALEDLPLENVRQLSLGVVNTCALVADSPGAPGRVHCWGSDTGGALGDTESGDFGDNEALDDSRPVALPEPAVAVATGGELACALLEGGAVHCWGDNWARTLGVGRTTCDIGEDDSCLGARGRRPEIPVRGLPNQELSHLYVQNTSACVLDAAGELWCWGRNSESRLGYPDAFDEYLGEAVAIDVGDGVRIVDVALGVRHACALDDAGQVRCWGEQGPALGYAMPENQGTAGIGGLQTPAQAYEGREDRGILDLGDFDGLKGRDLALSLAAGRDLSCALMLDGEVRCWGDNEDGALGYGEGVEDIGDDGTPGEELERLERSGLRFIDHEGGSDDPS